MGLLCGGGGPLQRRRAGVLLLLWRVEVGRGPWTEGRGRRVLVLRAGRQRLVGTLSHHVRDALAVVAFLWLGGQSALLGVVIQTSTVITATDVGGGGKCYACSLPLDGGMMQEIEQRPWSKPLGVLRLTRIWTKGKCGHGVRLQVRCINVPHVNPSHTLLRTPSLY